MKKVSVKSIKELVDSIQLNIEQEIVLQVGCYNISEPIVFNNLNCKVIIDGNGSTVKGSFKISDKWQLYKKNIWAVNIKKGLDIQAVFVDEMPYIMARYPNYKADGILNGYAKESISSSRVKKWNNPATGYVRALHNHDWGGNSYKIVGKTEQGELELNWVGDNNRGGDYHKDKIMVENIFEELDSPKEWFYDKDSGVLYVIPQSGVDLNACDVECAIISDLIKIEDSQDITIKNLNFSNTNRTMFNSTYEKITRSDWAVVRRGAIFLQNTENIKITDSSFFNIGGNCIFISGKNNNTNIENCEFKNCGASGIAIFGEQTACRDLSTWENHKTEIIDMAEGALNDKFPKNINILNSYFYNLGIFEKQSAAVTVSVASEVCVKGCTIHKLPRSGINVCDGCFGGHLFEDNDIFDAVRETGDHGPFNSWGRDRYWSLKTFNTLGKFGEIKKSVALLDAVKPIVINHNRIVGSSGFGIDLDDGSSNYKITNNLCLGVGIKLREGFFRTVDNNLLINSPLDLHCTFSGNDDVIKNNVVVSKSPLNIVFLNKGFTTKMIGNLFVNSGTKIFKNEIFKYGKDNKTVYLDDNLIKSMDFEGVDFKKFSMDFGRADKPKPTISLGESHNAQDKLKIYGAILKSITESERTVAGISNYYGLFVEKIGLGRLLFCGIKPGDVILEIDGIAIKDKNAMLNFKGKFKNILVSRSQQNLTLKSC